MRRYRLRKEAKERYQEILFIGGLIVASGLLNTWLGI